MLIGCNSLGNHISRHHQTTSIYKIKKAAGEAVYNNTAKSNAATIPLSIALFSAAALISDATYCWNGRNLLTS